MSNRTSIRDKLISKLREQLVSANSNIYNTDIDLQVFGKQLFLSQIDAFPAITIGLGREVPVYHPSGLRQNHLDLYFRCFIRNDDSPDEELEKIIQDIKTFVDLHEDFEYDVIEPGNSTPGPSSSRMVQSFTIKEIVTDEGILSPYGVAEILVTATYEDRNARFR